MSDYKDWIREDLIHEVTRLRDRQQQLTESNRQLREELEKVKAAEHPWVKALSKKWLDPECSDGCQSLKHKHRIERQDRALAAAKEALESCHCCDGANGVTSKYDSRAVASALARIAECEKGT